MSGRSKLYVQLGGGPIDRADIGQSRQIPQITWFISAEQCVGLPPDKCGPGRHHQRRRGNVGVALLDGPRLSRPQRIADRGEEWIRTLKPSDVLNTAESCCRTSLSAGAQTNRP